MCVIIAQNGEHNEQAEESEAFDSQGNPYVDPVDLTRGTGNKYPAAEGEPPREKNKNIASSLGESKTSNGWYSSHDNSS